MNFKTIIFSSLTKFSNIVSSLSLYFFVNLKEKIKLKEFALNRILFRTKGILLYI